MRVNIIEMKLDSVRFRGLHVVDLSKLTKHQYTMFGEDSHFTKKGWKFLNRCQVPNTQCWKSPLPNNKKFKDLSLFVPERMYTLKLADPKSCKRIVAFYSHSNKGKEFEERLIKYIKAFEKAYNNHQKIPHTFDPSVKGEKIDFEHMSTDNVKEHIEQIIGLKGISVWAKLVKKAFAYVNVRFPSI